MRNEEEPNSIRPQNDKEDTDFREIADVDTEDAEAMGEGGAEDSGGAHAQSDAEKEEEEAEVMCEECDPEDVKKRLKSPGTPTASEREIHNLTHWPFRSWCDACVRGRATGQQHRSMVGEYAESQVARVLMDYGFLHEEETVTETEHGKDTESKISMTVLVMMETMCKSLWAYAIEGKGAVSVDWVAQQVVEDIETVGLANERIITKTDQEPSIIQLQQEIAARRKDGGTALENSRVGDSDSNGKIERAIRDVKGMIRTLRSALEEKTGKTIRLDAAVVPWIVRHAAYILTRCKICPDGKTAMQKMKGRRVNVPWIPFGESVLFKLPKVPNMPGDFRDRFESGIWVGCTIRSGEHLVATEKGVYKVSSVVRRAEDKRWSPELIEKIRGTPKEPVPGSGKSNLVAYSKNKENSDKERVEYVRREIPDEPEVRPNYIFKKDIDKYGATEECPGCRALLNPNSKYRAKHTQECRDRIDGLLLADEGAARVMRAVNRNEAKAGKEESSVEGVKRRREETPVESSTSPQPAQGSQVEVGRDSVQQESSTSPKSSSSKPKSGDVAMQKESEPSVQLEEAPRGKGDIRVPLAARAPAQKRSAEVNDKEDGNGGKWQTVEVEDRKRDREERDRDTKIPHPSDADIPVSSLEDHPGPEIRREEIQRGDLVWKDIGSGTMARTFVGAKRLEVTTKGGPPSCDVHRRTVWNLNTGRIIDDCIIDDTHDKDLYRSLPVETDIRVELVLKDALAMYAREGADVVEIFSQPRIAQEASVRPYGGTTLRPGWSLDLTRVDPKTGEAWNLADKKVQSRVKKMIIEGKPMFVIGSPPCTAFSTMQNLSRGKRDPKIVERELEEGKEHIRFCIEIYILQIEGRRCFVHEHPSGATSWNMKEMIGLMMSQGVGVATVDMCEFGLTAKGKDGRRGPVQKCTRIISNSHEVLKRVDKKCPNRGGAKVHEHVVLEGRNTKLAQVYPREFCRAVCEGIAAEKRLRALGMEVLSLDQIEEAASQYGVDPSSDLHEDGLEPGMMAADDQSGEELDVGRVRGARKEEISYFRSMKVYDKVPKDRCWKETGKAPIGVRWVDINKGDTITPNYRSRLVAMEFKTDERPEWYAATPPSECLKILISKMASDKRRKMLYADVSRAYFYAPAARPVYVEIPEEDREPGDEEMCGRLRVSMYGTRDAALNWANEYGDTLKEAGYKQGIINPCLFYHAEKDVTILVHGDDFVAVGHESHLEETKKVLNDKYKIKVETLGDKKEEAKEIRVLNKVIRLTKEGLELEADPRHAELVIRTLGLEESKISATPGIKTARYRPPGKIYDTDEKVEEEVDRQGVVKVVDRDEGDEAMSKEDAKAYRGTVARLNYIASDRVDIQFAVKEAARNMSNPRMCDWHALTRIGKYIKGRPRLVMKYEWQDQASMAVTYTDSDWAGCFQTGKSTSGGIITLGKHMIKSYSRQQKTIALSSAEAELHAMVAASAETIGIVGLCKDMGIKVGGEVYADSSAALGIAQRSGNGKVRHLRVQALWVQEVRCTKRLAYKKVLGTRNPSDILTKHVPKELLDTHLVTVGVEVMGGRAGTAPTLDQLEPYTEEWKEELKGGEEAGVGHRTTLAGRKSGSNRVKFNEVVKVRAVFAEGRQRPTKDARKQRRPPEAEAPLEALGAGRGLRGGAGPASAGAKNFEQKLAGA